MNTDAPLDAKALQIAMDAYEAKLPDGQGFDYDGLKAGIAAYLRAKPLEVRVVDEPLAIRIVEALMRVSDRFQCAVRGIPVRDMAETLGEVESILRLMQAVTKGAP